MKKYWIFWAALFGVDRFSKLYAEKWLSGSAAIQVWPGVFRFQYVQNTGVAFSMLEDKGWLVSLMTALVLALIMFFYLKDKSLTRLTRAGMSLIVLGGLGNLLDRLIYGYVIDFIELTFMRFAVFNVADMMVCVGAGLAILGFFIKSGRSSDAVDG